MTTIVGDAAAGMLVADSNISNGDQKWTAIKVERIDGALYGTAGDNADGEKFYEWLRKGKRGRKPKLNEDEFEALCLNAKGLWWYDYQLVPTKMTQPFAIGSGGKAARAALLALKDAPTSDPVKDLARAVEIVCQVDAGSALPLQIYKLTEEKQQ